MLFSIIVPIYKVEDYLERSVNSVLSQGFSDFELILVDDGSPDKCPLICDEYKEKDERIKVIHKENGGLVSARQAGIKIAKGDYIINLDSDDALEKGALFKASQIIEKTGADIVSFAHRIYKNGEITETRHDFFDEGFYDKDAIKEKILPNALCNKNMKHSYYFIWGKAIKRDLILKNQLAVPQKISHGEDIACLLPCLIEAESIYVTKEVMGIYTVRGDSITTSFNVKMISQVADTVNHFKSYIENKDFDSQISRYSAYMCFSLIAQAAEGGHFRCLNEIKKLIKNSVHMDEIKKAEFEDITPKSKIAIALMKKRCFTLAFCFLNLCGKLKNGGR